MLEDIIRHKRDEIRKDRDYVRRLEELSSLRKSLHSFEGALTSCRTRIIAEVKKASPSEGRIRDIRAEEQAGLYQQAGAVAISVLTDRRFFNGSLEDLMEVRKAVNIPLLRKDFLLDPVQILEAKAYGADAVLLIVRILEEGLLRDMLEYARELGLSHLVEVFSLEEAEIALRAGAHILGINNRDLDTLRIDTGISERLAPEIKNMGAGFVVSESGIESREQVLRLENCGVDAFLVGTSLMKSQDPVKKLRELMGYNL